MLTAEQIRAARALLGWSQERLAREAGVSRPTIKRLESGAAARSLVATLDRVRGALEKAGVSFVPADEEGGAGVRLGKGAPLLLHRRGDALTGSVSFRIRFGDREYPCTARSGVLDRLDGGHTGSTMTDLEARFDRHAARILARARAVILEGLAPDGAVTLWPEDFT
jgi:transcriptional regulator with XRE-family HTH domain